MGAVLKVAERTVRLVVFAVEAPVAAASGAPERVVAAWHELAAAVEDVATEAGGMIPEALPVPQCRVRLSGSNGGGGGGRMSPISTTTATQCT